MPIIDVTYRDGSSERIHDVMAWDVHKSGRLVMWNAEGGLTGEREDVASAEFNREAQ